MYVVCLICIDITLNKCLTCRSNNINLKSPIKAQIGLCKLESILTIFSRNYSMTKSVYLSMMEKL